MERLSDEQYNNLIDVAHLLGGLVLGIALCLLLFTGVEAYPLQLYPNGTVSEVNLTINDTPLNIYSVNGSLYLIPAVSWNFSNYSLFNITNITVVNVTNLTCINCSYNYTNISYNNTNYDTRLTIVDSRLNSFENRQNELIVKVNNMNFTSISNLTSNSTNEWKAKDTYMSIGIVCAIILSLFVLGIVMRNQ